MKQRKRRSARDETTPITINHRGPVFMWPRPKPILIAFDLLACVVYLTSIISIFHCDSIHKSIVKWWNGQGREMGRREKSCWCLCAIDQYFSSFQQQPQQRNPTNCWKFFARRAQKAVEKVVVVWRWIEAAQQWTKVRGEDDRISGIGAKNSSVLLWLMKSKECRSNWGFNNVMNREGKSGFCEACEKRWKQWAPIDRFFWSFSGISWMSIVGATDGLSRKRSRPTWRFLSTKKLL
jgi:hypothetical protein